MEEIRIGIVNFKTSHWPLNPEMQTIVFVHGAGGSSVLWREQLKGLSGSFNTVAVDLPGHGGSSGSGMESIKDYAKIVEMFLESAGISRPVICGHSMGGAIIQELLIHGKVDYSAGILVNSGARLKVMPQILDLVRNNYPAYLKAFPDMAVSGKTARDVICEMLTEAGKCDPDTVSGDFTACSGFDSSDELEKINVPVLILTADEDRLTPLKYGVFLAENIKEARSVNIQDAGHLSPLEKGDDVNRAITEFLKGIV